MSDVLLLNSDYQPLSMIPLSTLTWELAITGICKETHIPLHYYDNWVVSSPTMEMQVPSVVVLKDFVKSRSKAVKLSRNNIYTRDHFTCQYCGKTSTRGHLNLDHVIPRSQGGKSSWENLATSCISCNSKKGANRKTPMNEPRKPDYYEIIREYRQYPIIIRDQIWNDYIRWPEELIRVA